MILRGSTRRRLYASMPRQTEPTNPVELAWKSHDNVAKAVERADTKAWIMMGLEAATAVFIYNLWGPEKDKPLRGIDGTLSWIYGCALFAIAIAGLLCL